MPKDLDEQSLNTRHISSNLSYYEAARTSFFVFMVPADQLTNLLKVDYVGDPETVADSDKYDSKHAHDAIRLNVLQTSIPNFSVKVEEYRRGNDVVKFAGVPTFAEGSLVIDDIVGMDTKSILYSWLYLAYNPNTRVGGRMKDYKKSGYLLEYTQDYERIRTWDLEGCFVNEINEDDFDRENDGRRKLNVKVSYDRATMSANEEPGVRK